MLKDASQVSPRPTDRPSCDSFSKRARRALRTSVAIAGFAACLPAAALADSAPTNCDKLASPLGSDSASGTAAAPLRSAQALTDALSPGQVGCLKAGTYAGGLRFNHGGRAGAPIVLRNYPGEGALITGRVFVPRGSDYVTVADLSLDGNFQSGSPLPSPTIAGNHTTFESDDVTNDHTEICFSIGASGYAVPDSVLLAGNHIHDCGRLPSRNEDHGIYVDDATNTQIIGNLINHNADRGIQLYPNSTGSVVMNNVISENGEGIIFGGENGQSSNNNVVEHNLIVKSLIRNDVESWYPAGTPRGTGNLVRSNCVSSRGINTSFGGFSASANVVVGAGELIATADGGYRPADGSACAATVPDLGSSRWIEVERVEGAPSGGAPNPVGKAVGGDTPPAPAAPAESTAPTAPAAPAAPVVPSAPAAPTKAPSGTAPTKAPTAGGSSAASTGKADEVAHGTPARHKRRSARKARRAWASQAGHTVSGSKHARAARRAHHHSS